MRLMRAVVLAMVIGLLAGCASTRLQKPELQVMDVDLLGGNLLKQQLRVRLKVTNPNDRQLAVRGVNYELEVAGDKFAHGSTSSEFVVPALGETEFDVDVSANMAGALLNVLGRGSKVEDVEYRILGTVHLASGFVRKIPFNHTGTLRLR
jgi:LEA14-like dessication related protein